MYLCYIDESGTPEVPGNTSHFVLAGVSIPIWHWNDADRDVSAVMSRYGLEGQELHTAWLLRPYLEQSHIPNFPQLDWDSRRSASQRARAAHVLQLQRGHNRKTYNQVRKNYKHTAAYTHLTLDERQNLVREVADVIGSWGFARLFAECIDKLHFDPIRTSRSVEEQAFEQVVSRFERYLANISGPTRTYGLLVHDNSQTIALKHTQLMRHFHRSGTLWTNIGHIIETPLFVDSGLTSMVQVADLCAYALRRFVENGETELFGRVFPRADRRGELTVGVRHYSVQTCACVVCETHSY